MLFYIKGKLLRKNASDKTLHFGGVAEASAVVLMVAAFIAGTYIRAGAVGDARQGKLSPMPAVVYCVHLGCDVF
jgi:hypothetical protein